MPEIRSISAVTFTTRDMGRAVWFYKALGFSMAYGGETEAFTSFRVGTESLNLARAEDPPPSTSRVRVIFHVDDVDPCMRTSWPGGSRRRRRPGTRHGASATST
jgi:catechol 2,3-dioxygenase-like lactoylglutathione lyase family enzyme